MKLIVELTGHAGDIAHHVVERFPCTVGRGYDNDIIIPDPHASPRHLVIDHAETGWIVADADSMNGTSLNGSFFAGGKMLLVSGDKITVGNTLLRVFTPDHVVAPAVRMQKANPLFLWISKPLNGTLLALAAGGFTALASYTEMWSDKPGAVTATVVGVAALIIVVWSACWSLAGRLIKHKSHFSSHIALASLYTVASTLIWFVMTYIHFLSNESSFSWALDIFLNFMLFTAFIYGCLALSATMDKKRRVSTALRFTVVMFAVFGGMTYLGSQEFSAEPLFPYLLEPYLANLAPADNIGEFMQSADKLFSKDTFSSEK